MWRNNIKEGWAEDCKFSLSIDGYVGVGRDLLVIDTPTIRNIWACLIAHKPAIVSPRARGYYLINVAYDWVNIQLSNRSLLVALQKKIMPIIEKGSFRQGEIPDEKGYKWFQGVHSVYYELNCHGYELLSRQINLDDFYNELLEKFHHVPYSSDQK